LQRTIAREISCTGIGLHSGAPARLTLRPAPADSGVVFVRSREGSGEGIEIPARSELVSSTANATTLSVGGSPKGVGVSTVEHLLATLRCLGIDNVRIEVDGPEVPVMDGSAAPFCALVRSAGASAQSAPRRALFVKKPVTCSDGRRSIRVEPARVLRISYTVDFEHPAIGRQELEIPDLTARVFEAEIAAARTFGFLEDQEALREAGLAGGASLANTVVLGPGGVLNPGGLRWPDEFVRHKVLDLLGDLALIGHPIRAHVRVERGGHSLHHALLAALRARPKAWTLVRDDAAPAPGAVQAEHFSPI
jgi:UDP-3-O-[3-hydroxymyristoyl] N-acetylglucosamine deacetylase